MLVSQTDLLLRKEHFVNFPIVVYTDEPSIHHRLNSIIGLGLVLLAIPAMEQEQPPIFLFRSRYDDFLRLPTVLPSRDLDDDTPDNKAWVKFRKSAWNRNNHQISAKQLRSSNMRAQKVRHRR